MEHHMQSDIPLTELAAQLAAEEGIRASYRALYQMYLDGRLPGAKRSPNGRISTSRPYVPEIAERYVELHPSAAVVLQFDKARDAYIAESND
jgi:hypothetical protein